MYFFIFASCELLCIQYKNILGIGNWLPNTYKLTECHEGNRDSSNPECYNQTKTTGHMWSSGTAQDSEMEGCEFEPCFRQRVVNLGRSLNLACSVDPNAFGTFLGEYYNLSASYWPVAANRLIKGKMVPAISW